MKYLPEYQKLGVTEQNLFDYFMSTLKESIVTWEYFTDFKKVSANIKTIEIELAILNTLIGKENIEQEFIRILREYPKVRSVLPILIALRREHLSDLNIISNLETFETKDMSYLFEPATLITEEVAKEYLKFFSQSGLKNFFEARYLKNVIDYCYGVEVGLDTNGRKNRTGTIMEQIVEQMLLKQFGYSDDLRIMKQVSASMIDRTFNLKVDFGRKEKGKERKIDFVIVRRSTGEIYAIETNAYMGGGSKLKATAGEYIMLSSIIAVQKNVKFIWITDGPGWHTTREPLREAFGKIDHIFNLKMVEDGILRSIINAGK